MKDFPISQPSPNRERPPVGTQGRLGGRPVVMTEDGWRFVTVDAPPTLTGMTQDKWDAMTPAQRTAARDNSGLTPQLIGKEGWRVEVVTEDGEKRRFIVGKSTGWRPCHLEIKTTRSMGGDPAAKTYKTVRAIERVR